MFAVGVDVSNGRSTVAVLGAQWKVVMKPFEVSHTADGFASLIEKLRGLNGEARTARSVKDAAGTAQPHVLDGARRLCCRSFSTGVSAAVCLLYAFFSISLLKLFSVLHHLGLDFLFAGFLYALATYPFTEPIIMPCTKYRCTKGYAHIIGSVLTMIIA